MPFPVAVHARSGSGHVVEIEFEVIGDKQVEMPVSVVIDERTAGSPSGFNVDESRFSSHILKVPSPMLR